MFCPRLLFLTNFYHLLSPAPGGKPVILAAHNTSATSVRVRWRPLAKQELRGEFQAYKITYRERNNTTSPIKELKITEESVQVRTRCSLSTKYDPC